MYQSSMLRVDSNAPKFPHRFLYVEFSVIHFRTHSIPFHSMQTRERFLLRRNPRLYVHVSWDWVMSEVLLGGINVTMWDVCLDGNIGRACSVPHLLAALVTVAVAKKLHSREGAMDGILRSTAFGVFPLMTMPSEHQAPPDRWIDRSIDCHIGERAMWSSTATCWPAYTRG